MPETTDNTDPCIYHVFFYTSIYFPFREAFYGFLWAYPNHQHDYARALGWLLRGHFEHKHCNAATVDLMSRMAPWLTAGLYRVDTLDKGTSPGPGRSEQEGAGFHQDTHNGTFTYELLISEIFHLIFLDQSWPWVTETVEGKTLD